MLEEYSARYGVRFCYRHLCYLNDLLDKAEQGQAIDPTLLNFCFNICSNHVHGAVEHKSDKEKEKEKEKLEKQAGQQVAFDLKSVYHHRKIYLFLYLGVRVVPREVCMRTRMSSREINRDESMHPPPKKTCEERVCLLSSAGSPS